MIEYFEKNIEKKISALSFSTIIEARGLLLDSILKNKVNKNTIVLEVASGFSPRAVNLINNEGFNPNQYIEVLKNEFKYDIKGFVLDGAKPITRAVEKVYPEAKIQRCLTHIHRQTRNYLSKNPKIKKSNNDLEGLNGILNTQINRHKGLRIDRLISFISLWIYERNLKKK